MKNSMKIVSDSLRPEQLYQLLQESDEIKNEKSINLKLIEDEDETLGLDPVSLNAIITGAISVTGILITGIFTIWKTNRANKAASIVLKGKGGTSVTFPAGSTEEEIDILIKKAQQLDNPVLVIKER